MRREYDLEDILAEFSEHSLDAEAARLQAAEEAAAEAALNSEDSLSEGAEAELPEEECMEILTKAPRGFLSVIGDGGYPYSVPVNFFQEDGRIYFHCAREGHKLDAVRSCDKACFTVIDEPSKEPGDWWYHVRSVICFGRICEVSDEVRHDALLRKLGLKYFPEGYDMEDDMRRNAPRAVVLEFRIEHMTGKRVKEK